MSDNRIKRIIIVISIVVPVLVALLLFTPISTGIGASWISLLPVFHAIINSATSVILILAVWSVIKGKIAWHKKLMSVAFVLGGLFLLSYVLYHSSTDSVKFGDINGDGLLSNIESDLVSTSRIIYLVVLLSHIVLSVIVLPLVLFTFYYSLTEKIVKHKKIVKFTFPIWLYVSITGVIVYLMISPYY